MPVFDFNDTTDAKNKSICTYTTFQSSESDPSPEKPIMLLDNTSRKWEHYSCGVFTNPVKRTSFEFDTEEGTYQYNNGIDYWTFGQLTILRNQIATARAYLEHAEEMKLPQLQEAEEELYSLQEQLLLLENAAHINVAMSVSRRISSDQC